MPSWRALGGLTAIACLQVVAADLDVDRDKNAFRASSRCPHVSGKFFRLDEHSGTDLGSEDNLLVLKAIVLCRSPLSGVLEDVEWTPRTIVAVIITFVVSFGALTLPAAQSTVACLSSVATYAETLL